MYNSSMPRKRKTLDDRLTSWLRKPDRTSRSASRRKGSGADALLAELQEEQSRLSAELEKAFLAYDKKTRNLSKTLAKWTESGVGIKELERLRQEQEDLWRVVRRAQAAERTNRQLETELREWSGRDETCVRSTHPDHPGARTEIVSSELRLRGRDPSGLVTAHSSESFEGSAKDVNPLVEALEAIMPEPEEIEIIPERASAPVIEGVEWRSETDELIIREIEHCCREIRRTHAHEDGDALVGEIVMMLKDLRMLHAHLRTHDRKAGIRRYRLAIGEINSCFECTTAV